ncbi:MAG: VWA domain-containing protein [Candidatus Omnitrophica bacterium]|nr:VWA domain-containing protein [Candidatus Omnitrophota bacterium]
MDDSTQVRWRLILGRYAKKRIDPRLGGEAVRMERALDFLYGREYQGRGLRGRDGQEGEKGPGSLDESQLSVPKWLEEVRDLFPRETLEVVEKHALERYDLRDLVTDRKTLEKLEPNQDLLKMILQFKGSMNADVLNAARRIIRKIVEDLRERMAREVQQCFSGRLNRYSHSPLKISQNFDWQGTLKSNLKNWQVEEKRLALEHLKFFSRKRRQLPWNIVLCIDQSGSMASSVIHSAVLAGILSGLPSLNVKLVTFDTSVVDLSEHVGDPVEVLMSVQLGGGTDIGQALCYCEGLIETPQRTVLALISDFFEGAPPNRMLGAVKRLKEAGVTLIGLAALDSEALPDYDPHTAGQLAAIGMDITASTPGQFAEWLAKRIS